jgi:pSer/pThr/pTyr-binding forkhead associated (FHA) protein
MLKKLILETTEGSLTGEKFIFEETGAYIIGRSKYCALQISNDQDIRISRQHLMLILDPDKARIRDLGSKNGTNLNGRPIPPGEITEHPEIETPADREIKPGDIISIGNTTLQVDHQVEEFQEEEQIIPLIDDVEQTQIHEKILLDNEPETQSIPRPDPGKITNKKTTVPPAPAIKKHKPDFEITTKDPQIPLKFKIRPSDKPQNTQPSQKHQRTVLEPELPTIVMNPEELENLADIDDTQLKPPEKKRKATFTIKTPSD